MTDEKLIEQLKTEVEGLPADAMAVLCVGNPMRGDDGFGPAVFAALSGRIESALFDGAEAPENLLGALARLEPRLVVVVDAVIFGGAPGELALLEPGGMRTDGFDTHTASLSIISEFLREACGARLRVLAVQPACTELGTPLAPQVYEAVGRAADILAAALP